MKVSFMKTCVLFPKAFSYNYIDGSVAHSMDSPTLYEEYLSPSDLAGPKLIRKRMTSRSMSLMHRDRAGVNPVKKKPKMLHVEDSAQIRLLVSIFLKNEFDVESVENGEVALKQVKSKQYDFILMDINLGRGIDGFDVINEIRDLENYKSTPIIALTTNDYPNVREACLKSRVNAYIQKPFEKTYLIGTIQEINNRLEKENNA
ncbi:MAG: response regulator [Balneolaceae bacterium]|nr:response regulator [Balneolaceae bacterium]